MATRRPDQSGTAMTITIAADANAVLRGKRRRSNKGTATATDAATMTTGLAERCSTSPSTDTTTTAAPANNASPPMVPRSRSGNARVCRGNDHHERGPTGLPVEPDTRRSSIPQLYTARSDRRAAPCVRRGQLPGQEVAVHVAADAGVVVEVEPVVALHAAGTRLPAERRPGGRARRGSTDRARRSPPARSASRTTRPHGLSPTSGTPEQCPETRHGAAAHPSRGAAARNRSSTRFTVEKSPGKGKSAQNAVRARPTSDGPGRGVIAVVSPASSCASPVANAGQPLSLPIRAAAHLRTADISTPGIDSTRSHTAITSLPCSAQPASAAHHRAIRWRLFSAATAPARAHSAGSRRVWSSTLSRYIRPTR